MLRDAHFRAKRNHRGRGLRDLKRTVGGVVAEIDARLERQAVVRVLELGCGYGTALLELRARYGPRIELHGQNRLRNDGDADILLRNARERNLLGTQSDAVPLPSIVHGDVALGVLFPDASIDVVYSQVAWLYFRNKVGVVRDVMRVLREDGIAKIDADDVRSGVPSEYARLVEIWENGALIPFKDYVRRYGMAFEPAPDGEYLRFGKLQSFGDELEPVVEVDLAALHAHWDGVKCVYRVRRQPLPPDAPPGRSDPDT
jgi:SAM-dependent methyltransferase